MFICSSLRCALKVSEPQQHYQVISEQLHLIASTARSHIISVHTHTHTHKQALMHMHTDFLWFHLKSPRKTVSVGDRLSPGDLPRFIFTDLLTTLI